MPEKWLKWEDGKEWGKIQCPMLDNEYVMTYYPEFMPVYYSYTAPFVVDGDVCFYRYDHDAGGWDEDVLFELGQYEDGVRCVFRAPESE